jgi:uncharacterized protein (DUF2267 family)
VRERDSADLVARALDALTLGGERVIEDSAIYTALRDAYWRLETDRSPQSIGSVVDQLWDVALRIEDGDLPEAERDVKQAQDELAKALKENASPEEIKRLVDELRNALSRYLQAMAEQAQQKGNLPPQEKQNGDQLISQQDLDKMLNNIEKLAKAGSKDLAEQMLSELKDVLERLQTGTFSDDAKQQRSAKMMKDLNNVVSKQQKLLDDTFDAKRKKKDDSGFAVSPPGQPMEFGQGISMAPFGMPEQQGDAEDSRAGQDSSGEGDQSQQGKSGRNSQQSGQNGQRPRPGQSGGLASRQGELRVQLRKLADIKA